MDTGFKNPASAANVDTGGSAWNSVTNIYTSNNTYAVSSTFSDTDRLAAYNFSVALPVGTKVDGIEVGIEGYESIASIDYSVRLYKNVSTVSPAEEDVSDVKTATVPNGSGAEAVVLFGGATDLWGETWTRDDVNASTFGVGITTPGGFTDVYVDHVKLKIYYSYVGGSRVQFIG